MAFPSTLTNAIDAVTDVVAAHLNNLEAKVGIDGSLVTTSLDYLLKNPASVSPGHRHVSLHKPDGSFAVLTVDSSGILKIGADSATPVNQTFKAGDGVGTNITGDTLIIAGGRGTGNALGGRVVFQTSPVGASGSTANALVDRLAINSAGTVTIGSIMIGGALGNGRLDQYEDSDVDGAIHVLGIRQTNPVDGKRAGHCAFKANDDRLQQHTVGRFMAYISDVSAATISSQLILDFMDQVNGTGGYSYPNKAISIDRFGMTLPGIPINLGGLTSSYPAIVGNGAAINFRLADNSADAAITAAAITASGKILSQLVAPGADSVRLALENQSSSVGTSVSISFNVSGTPGQITGKIANYYATSGDRGLTFWTYDGSLTERMRITGPGSVVIGATAANAAALLQLSSTIKGFLPPVMSAAQMAAITNPPSGLIVFNSTSNKLMVYATGAWQTITSS
jgi:hypothetical protein